MYRCEKVLRKVDFCNNSPVYWWQELCDKWAFILLLFSTIFANFDIVKRKFFCTFTHLHFFTHAKCVWCMQEGFGSLCAIVCKNLFTKVGMCKILNVYTRENFIARQKMNKIGQSSPSRKKLFMNITTPSNDVHKVFRWKSL